MRAMSDASRDHIDLDLLTPETLATLSERDFRLVVTADLRKDASNERIRGHVPPWITATLRGRLAARRLAALQGMLANVEGQIEMRSDRFEVSKVEAVSDEDLRTATGAYYRDLSGPKRFRSALLESLPEAEQLVNDRINQLERAIRAHRQAIEANPKLSPSVIDEALWAMISN